MGKRLIPLLALGTVLATPAHGQSLSSKSDAILGGSPSRLAAILAAQSGTPTPVPTLVAATAVTPSLLRAVPFPSRPAAPRNLPASSDRPDVFNSVALAVAQTPLDGRWARVARGGVGGAAGAFAQALADLPERARLEAVNRFVNDRVAFVDDAPRFGSPDRWSAAAETLASGVGDCEDYAIAKMAMLRRAGFSERDLYLVVLKDLVRRADHAVLVVRSEGRFLVLDNGTDRIVESSEVRDYRPILTFTAGRAFTHGYRREIVQPPVIMAAADPSPTQVIAAAAASMPVSMFAFGGLR